MKIYNLGSLNIDYVYSTDHFVLPGETLASDSLAVFPGGKGLNQSVALAKAGVKVIHGGAVGEDGAFLIETMKKYGVITDRIFVTDGKTGHAIIEVDRNGQNRILLYAGANHKISAEYVESFLSDANEGDILLLQNEVNSLDLIFKEAIRKKMKIAFNPSPYREELKELPTDAVSFWFCNELEGEAFFGCSFDMIEEVFPKLYPDSALILTLGEGGSKFISKNETVYQPIYETETVDTTAAGDTFTGYFLSEFSRSGDVKTALRLASRAASITVSRHGASESIPARDEVIL